MPQSAIRTQRSTPNFFSTASKVFAHSLALRSPSRDAAARGDGVDIGADRLAVFRLAFGGGDHARIGRDALEGEIESGAGDAFGLRVRPELGLEGGEGLLGVLRLRRRAAKAENDGEDGKRRDEHG